MGTKMARISEDVHARAKKLSDQKGISFAEALRKMIEGAPDQAEEAKPEMRGFDPEDFRIIEDVDELRQELAELREAQDATRNDVRGLGVGIAGLLAGQDVLAEQLEAEGMNERRLEAMRRHAERIGLPASVRDPVLAVIEAKLAPMPALSDGGEA